MQRGTVASVVHFLPEIVLIGAVVLLVLVGLVTDTYRVAGIVALLASALTLVLVIAGGSGNTWLFNGMIVFDAFAFFFRLFIVLATVVAVWMAIGSEEVKLVDQGQYYAVLLAGSLGIVLMAEATHLPTAYLSLQPVSLT